MVGKRDEGSVEARVGAGVTAEDLLAELMETGDIELLEEADRGEAPVDD